MTTTPTLPGSQPQEIAFVFDTLPDWEALANAARPGVEVVVLKGTQDGLAQIADALHGRSGIDALHILSHGEPGQVQLGSLSLGSAGIAGHADTLARIGQALTPGGDILLYGCNTAAGDAGTAFIAALAAATGADVAASTDLTGAAALGGNWVLEKHQGDVQTGLALSGPALVRYSGVLATPASENFESYAQDGSGIPTSPRTLGDFQYGLNGTNPASYVLDAMFGFGYLTGQVLALNFDSLNGITRFTLQAASLANNFTLQSLKLEAAGGPATTASTTFIVKGYDGGSGGQLLMTETVDLRTSDALGTITYAKDPNYPGGQLAFNSAWGNVDTIVFEAVGGDGINMGIDDIVVSTAVPDTVPPAFASATVNGSTLVMTYTEASMLDASNLPSAISFTVMAGGSPITVNSVAVNATAKTVTLTLAAPVIGGQAVTVAYTDPTGGNDVNAIQDTAGNDAVSLTATTVTNNTPDTTPPAFASAAVNGNSLVMTYTEATTLDAVNKPGTNAFAVTAGGSGVGVSSVAVDANAKTVTLTLASAVTNGQAVTVAYTDPTGGNDANAIQDAAGNDAVSLTATAVTNNTPDTTAPTITSIVRQTPAAATTNADTLVYRVTFSEDVTNVFRSIFLTTGGSNAEATQLTAVSGSVYDVTVAEGDLANFNGPVTLGISGGQTIKDIAGNALASTTPTGTNDVTYTLDNTAPTLAITSNVPQVKTGETATVTFTFSEDPGATFTWDGTAGDVAVSGGTLGAVSGSGLTRTATFTPSANTDATTASITVAAGTYQDMAGNNGGPGTTPALALDTKAPTVVSIDRQTPVAGTTNADSLVYRVTFSEAVTGVNPGGFDVTGGSNASVTNVKSAGGNAFDITVAEGDIANFNGPVTLGLVAVSGIKDTAGNALAGTTPSGTNNPTYTLDNTAPTLAITSNTSILPIGNTATITFTFTEDPGASFTWNGTSGDVVVTGGTLGAISGSGLTRTATFTPTANTNNTQASITVAAGTYTDAAGNNGGAGTTPSLTIDTLAPTLASSAPLDNATGVSVSNNLTLTFSENVTAAEGLVSLRKSSDNSLVEEFDVTTGEGSLNGTVSISGTTLTLDPHGDLDFNTGYYLLAQFGVVKDGAGNYFDAITLPTALNFTTGNAPSSGGGGGGGTPPATTVDGTPVTTTTAADGTTTTTVPVVANDRPETPGTPTSLADIPLAKDATGQSLLQAGVPTGMGLTAEGLASAPAGQADLAQRIQKLAGTGSDLGAQAQAFLATLGSSAPLTVQTITPTTGAGFNPNVPLVITGGAGNQAIVVDTRALPSGTVIQVDNVEFIAIIGAVRAIGGAGQNTAIGDGSAQWVVLGPGNDVIHGGAGNDTVGSEGGDDQVFGDAGDDTVFGGAGNDILSGGTGSDKLNGGTGFDVALQEGKRTDYTVTLDGAGVKLTHIASGVSDWLVDVEQVRFETGPILTIAHSAAEEAAAYLFQKWLGRDLNQGEGAAIQTLAGQSAEQVASLFAQLFPTQTAGKTVAQLLDGMATAGAVRLDAVRDVIVSGDAGNNTITPVLGLARYVDGGAGIDTVVLPATQGQTHLQSNAGGNFTLQRLTDGAMLDISKVERITFNDTKLALDLNGHAGEAAKLLGALAGPGILASKGVVGEVIRMIDAGASSQTVANLGLQLLGVNTPTQIAQTLWTNITGRAGTSAELKILTDIMAGGTSAADLVVMAAHLDATATRIDLVGLAAKGLEFA